MYKVCSFLLLLLFSTHVCAGEIALTFDDAPTPDSAVMDGDTRTARLLRELRKSDVNEALFFVTTKYVNDASAKRLKMYTEAGHYLANHSHEHVSANESSVVDFLVDAYRAHLILKPFDHRLPLYRFPFLHEGMDPSSRQNMRDGLAELGYSIGYVTVDNFDWYVDSVYREAVKAGKYIDHQQLSRLYVDMLWNTIVFYDEVAKKTLKRSPKHVLLLHENDLAAIFIGDLVRHIRSKGWKIISPREAYADPIALERGDFTFTKQGMVAALAHRAGMNIEHLRHESENKEYIDQLFHVYKVFGAGSAEGKKAASKMLDSSPHR